MTKKKKLDLNAIVVCRGVQARAEYLEQEMPGYDGNPFIEALPAILTEDQAADSLGRYPPYDERERLLPSHVRLHLIQNALQFFEPLPVHLDLEQRFSRMIRGGYRMRNPMDRGFWNNMNTKLESLASSTTPLRNQARPLPTGFTIIGCPGVGKSTSVEGILSLYPQVIFHGQYKDRDFTRAQVVWLKLECPFDGSTNGLCLSFFHAVDDILGTNYLNNYANGRRTGELLLQMARVAANHGLGVLVIDEIQRLSRLKSGGAEKMLNFFVQLANTIGVPVVLVGTHKARAILSGEFHQIRRGSGQGDLIWDPMPEGTWVEQTDPFPGLEKAQPPNPDIWQFFLEALWKYQYLRTPSTLTPELSHTLYLETQGITDFAAKVFMLAQARAITTSVDGTEELTSDIIRSVAADSLKEAREVLHALRMGDTAALNKYEDIQHVDVHAYFQQSLRILEDQEMPPADESAPNRDEENPGSASPQPNTKPKTNGGGKQRKGKKTTPTYALDDVRSGIESAKERDTSPEEALRQAGLISTETEYVGGVKAA